MYALVIGLLLAVFVLVSWQVTVAGPLLAADVALRDASAGLTRPRGPLTAFAEAGADLGGAPVAGAALAVGAGLAAWRDRSWVPPAVALFAAAAVPALVLPLKEVFGRGGPDGQPLDGYAGYYPSGHTLTAVVAYGTAALLLSPGGRPRGRSRVAAPTAAALLSLCTGVGLVLRGYHWATDVVAGWALGGLVLCVVASVRRGSRRGAARSRPGPGGTTPRSGRPPVSGR